MPRIMRARLPVRPDAQIVAEFVKGKPGVFGLKPRVTPEGWIYDTYHGLVTARWYRDHENNLVTELFDTPRAMREVTGYDR